jgi:hypothetical protein
VGRVLAFDSDGALDANAHVTARLDSLQKAAQFRLRLGILHFYLDRRQLAVGLDFAGVV